MRQELPSPAMYTTVPAVSSGVPARPWGTVASRTFLVPSLPATRVHMAVST
ncbi:MAG TPA: hypothetical protein VGG75_17035 [Trebonia sp.]